MRKRIREETIRKLSEIEIVSDELLKEMISNELIHSEASKQFSVGQRIEMIERIFADIRGFDVLQTLLDDPSISEIMVNGVQKIFVEKHGKLLETPLSFDDEERLEYIIQKMVSKVGRTVNTMHPIVDARLESGDRINVVLPPVSLNGPILTIRKFQDGSLNMDQLIKIGTLSRECATELKTWMGQKYNIFISGGTGSGKTTFLNALAEYIGPQERVISMEDSAELRLQNLNNWIRLESRNKNAEGEGEITIRDLLKTSLRMRPDRIIVGEIRGKEALDMLQAMNTGHDGSLSTGHANSPLDMLRRIETMVMSSSDIPLPSIKNQIQSAIDILIHIARFPDGSRKITKICAVDDSTSNDYRLIDIYRFQSPDHERSASFGRLERTGEDPEAIEKLKRKSIGGGTYEDHQELPFR
ncbi:MAG: CpaF family protein [Bacillota bacterium]|nr:CpaF family protein [Bacillota bacterium]